MTELLDVARGLGMVDHKPVKKARVAVLSFSGGAGVVSSDEIADHGMELADLSPETCSKLRQVFPDWMDPANPVDLYPAIEKNGPTQSMKAALEAVMEDPGVDAVYAHLFAPPIKVPLFNYDHIAEVVGKSQKPLVVWIMGAGEGAEQTARELEKRGVPVVFEIRKGVRLLAAVTMRR